MRKSILIICGLVLAICSWLLLHRPTKQTGNESQAVRQAFTNRQSVPTNPKKNAVKSSFRQSPTDFLRALGIDTNSKVPIPQQLLQKHIDFYGKVIDENSNPVVNANIEFSWDDMTAKNWTRASTTVSDLEGLFSLHDKTGATLAVSVSKEGYLTSRSSQGYFQYAFGNPNFSPNPNNPIIFHLHKKGQAAQLTTSAYGIRDDFPVLVPRDGTPVNVDLLQRKIDPSGDLQISQIKPERAQMQQATNWSFQMKFSDGGFIEENDDFPFTAPETGYQPAIDMDFEKGSTNWATQFSKDYYIMFGQPTKYGLLHVEGNIAQQTIFLKYAINPTGSQNLEPAN